MNFQETFQFFKKAGIKAIPIPGTNKYHVSFRDGQSIYVRENTLMKLAQAEVKDLEALIQTLKQNQTPLA